jgi:hypothetical protein
VSYELGEYRDYDQEILAHMEAYLMMYIRNIAMNHGAVVATGKALTGISESTSL